jgi:hypothetical protein
MAHAALPDRQMNRPALLRGPAATSRPVVDGLIG